MILNMFVRLSEAADAAGPLFVLAVLGLCFSCNSCCPEESDHHLKHLIISSLLKQQGEKKHAKMYLMG